MGTKQQQIYDFIKKHIAEKQYSPSVREITKAVELKSTSTTHGHLDRMRKKGLIDFVDSLPRTLRVI